MNSSRMVIVTGLSGSGRSAALKSFEDTGYYCVDNLPLPLLEAFAAFAHGAPRAARSAIGLDVREKGFPEQFPALFTRFREAGRAVEMLFLEANDQALVRRFSETRRPHPLARGETPLLDGIRQEREALAAVRNLADRIIDTSDYTVHDLRQAIQLHYADSSGLRPLVTTIVTFGYKYGVPYNLDLLFDLRFLPNPHFVPDLKPLTGEDALVSRYVLDAPGSEEFLSRLQDFLAYLLPRYRSEGKSYLVIGFGCTGGRHRSVAVAQAMAERLRHAGHEVNVKHRDVGV
ncbi:MAG: RNase adaptor protein RapZ [Nitrospirae bacterium GWC2_57_13]|jgi:RNase adapter protein RapZ|nr:MAG: RNase adaptor protein RapZ [Nitrospirae bacterium GWC2_57_13]OGW41506.1 MAG: RNase adaptor protein RapZ [Nitrospirae bacterium GWD2_57_8]HAS55172.1 RNase adapter RapZ [Nitrospiraceae bacterium]